MNNLQQDSYQYRFSNEKYATKEEVKKELKVGLVDGFWNKILEYRSQFSFILSLEHFDKSRFSICLVPNVQKKVSQIEKKLTKTMGLFYRLENTNNFETFKKESYIKCLKNISTYYNIDITIEEINNIIDGNISIVAPNHLIISNYYNALKNIYENSSREIDDNAFATFYQTMLGNQELLNYYRSEEISNKLSQVVIGKLYLGIPTSNIESSMNSLIYFIKNSEINDLIKAIVSFYYFYYIKPFDYHSEAMSLLVFKQILANSLDNVASLINLETLFLDVNELENAFLESQKSHDLTYLLVYILEKMENIINEFLENITLVSKNAIKKEVYKQDEYDSIIIGNDDIPLVSKNLNTEEEIKEIIKGEDNQLFYKNIAISNVPTGLSEEEAKKLEIRLMEMDPSLSRSQAYFYARHCTENMKYTISQFKKELGCAYETARSSMDKLVYSGYYRKEHLKNKFIYIPMSKRRKI